MRDHSNAVKESKASAAWANRHIVVADSSHYIQVERSQVVVDAIEQARDAVRNSESPIRSFTARFTTA